MYRFVKTHLPILPSNLLRPAFQVLLMLLFAAGSCSLPAHAQQGDGTIQGTISDQTGAVIAGAAVTVINVGTGVETKRVTNRAGDFNASPLQAGQYMVHVEARGFEQLLQENVTLNSTQTLGLNMKLKLGAATEQITVTDAPPMLDTQDASLGGTIENELYTDLPLSMNQGPRDPTQFQYLMPGVSEGGGTTGVFGGSGQEFLNQNYINGVPVSSIAAQGDPTTVRNAVSVDAVDQFQVKTNGAGVAFGGAGVTNYTIKSGVNQMHGTVFTYIRNTMFDSWGYFTKIPGPTGYATKPGEHQISYGGSVGGAVIKDKLFYFAAYEGFHYTKISNTPQYVTIPTMRERQGDFTDAFGTGNATQPGVAGIFDPIPGNATTRNQFQGLLNGVATFNVIPQNEISSISQYLMQALPKPTNLSTSLNYLAGLPLQNDDYRVNGRVDYDISKHQRISIIGLGGLNGYNAIPKYTTQTQLPVPYAAGAFTSQKSATGIITDAYTITQHLINTATYSLTRTWGQSYSPTTGSIFSSAQAGIGNLPSGSASTQMPSVTFSGGGFTAEVNPTNWASNLPSGPQSTNSFTLIDNLLWVKGRHNITFGMQAQWLQTNAASYGGYSGATALTYSGYNTENLQYTSTTNTTSAIVQGGSAFASFLIGAVYTGNVRTQTIADVGGRYKPLAPYIQDSWRVTSKVTIVAGLRYDYLQPYHEAKDRLAFLNPDATNPITGNKGAIYFGGFGTGPDPDPAYAPYICQCRSPIHPYNANWEPQLAVAYAPTRTTAIRANFGVITTHAGGTGGHANATAGPGTNSEYAFTNVWQGANSTSQPSFFLNPGIQGSPQNAIFAPGAAGQASQRDFSSIPTWVPAGSVGPLATTGNYALNGSNLAYCPISNQVNAGCTPTTQNYVDLYYGGRGPQFVNYNIGFQQEINKQGVISINYAGSQTHFLPGGAGRGPATNGISPDYGAILGHVTSDLPGQLGSIDGPILYGAFPNYRAPTWYGGELATVARSFSPYPQFGNLTDIWGATGNSNYNAMQLTYVQRPWHGVSGFVNYTWSKSIDDTGTHRTQYGVTALDGNFAKPIAANGVDRSLGLYDQRQTFNGTFNWDLPFGRGRRFLAKNKIVGAIVGGWSVSGIVKIREGFPLEITYASSCYSNEYAFQGTCMPDYNPAFMKGSARINGKWGRAPGSNASNIQTIQYIDSNAFQCAGIGLNNGGCGQYMLGNSNRAAPYGLRGPGWKDMDMGFRRTFDVIQRAQMHLTFQLEADVANITNSTFFSLASNSTAWGLSCAANLTTLQQCPTLAFGTIGGQNAAVPPRDWQFAGRFRF